MQTNNVNLPIKVTGRHVAVTQAISDYATKKIEGLHLDYPRIIEAHVILDVIKHRQFAEIILHCTNHITIEASAETSDLYASIDEVVAKIARQMRKYKTRIMRQHRPRRHEVQPVDEHVFDVAGLEEHPEVQPSPVQTEKYLVKPMYVDDAILQLEMSPREFVVFLNAETEKVNVLYRRKNGHYGLIVPSAA
jgi:putative sigma-54 modulation protein